MELREPESDGEPVIGPAPGPTAGGPDPEAHPELPEPEARRYPSTLGGLCYLLVLAVATVGLVIVLRDDWRVGVKWIAVSLLAGAVARLLLPAPQAGMLAVRRRLVDVLLLTVVGVALYFLAGNIPDQPPL